MRYWIKLFSIVFVIIIGIIVAYFYVFTSGFRNYRKFCSYYVPLIEEFKKENGNYPKNLDNFDKPIRYFRYKKGDCNYIMSEAEVVMFWSYPPFGVEGYDFNKKEYWID